VPEDAPFLVAGSTHAGEEEAGLHVYQELRASFPSLRVLIAPRHIERVEAVLEVAQQMGIEVERRTQRGVQAGVQAGAQAPVVVLDTVGELSEIYAAADVTFVGGSLVERGGTTCSNRFCATCPLLMGHTSLIFVKLQFW
jgi:3-deoxy-D-manno-octulosonic-acid transferase